MDSLNEDDLKALTNIENRLLRLRKREVADRNILCNEISRVIGSVHELRQLLQIRFEMKMDEYL